jgi:PAS domain S-box-containing protein
MQNSNSDSDRLLGSERYKLVFDISPEVIVILDEKGHVLEINGRVYNWLGYSIDEIRGKSITELPYLTPEGKELAVQKFSARIQGKDIPAYEIEFEAKNGNKLKGKVMAKVIKDQKGNIVGEVVIISDVTEDRKLNNKLQEKVNQLESLTSVMVGRELRMVEMKKEISELKKKNSQ